GGAERRSDGTRPIRRRSRGRSRSSSPTGPRESPRRSSTSTAATTRSARRWVKGPTEPRGHTARSGDMYAGYPQYVQTDAIRLTEFSHGAGCACKIGPDTLREVLGTLGPAVAPPAELLVSNDTGDDAAAYSLGDGRALIATTDFFTPIVDDPGDWGRIAATNALSDVYAMGGTPALALNLVGWPREGLAFELLARVLEGGAASARA